MLYDAERSCGTMRSVRREPPWLTGSQRAIGARLQIRVQIAQVGFYFRIAFPGGHEEEGIVLTSHFRHHGLADGRRVVAARGIQAMTQIA
jgi:hypothetical protein